MTKHLPSAPGRQPIFVLGMPRSGTTLVEQILASHPLVFGAGELNAMQISSVQTQVLSNRVFPGSVGELSTGQCEMLAEQYLRRLYRHAGSAEYAVDKLPHNFLYIGLIKYILPGARIIHCRRNPLDTCLSIYKNDFTGNHPYSHDLKDLGDYYLQYLHLMSHWHSVFPFEIYDVQYENLVTDTDEEVRALLKFCGLSFEAACLEFHKTQRIVATASTAQVRNPVSTKSVALWKEYREQLQPLIGVLSGI